MRNSSSLDWLRFMHTPNDYRVSPFNISRFINKLDNKYKGIPTIEQIEGRDVAGIQKKNHLPLLGKVVLIFFIYS